MKSPRRIDLARGSARNLAATLRVEAIAPAVRIDPKTGARIQIGPAEMARAKDKQFVTVPRSLPGTGEIKKPK